MRIDQLDPSCVGRAIRVTYVTSDEAETMGYVNDSKLLTGATGTIRALQSGGSAGFAQIDVDYDEIDSSLSLVGTDEVEFINQEGAS